MLYKKNDAPRLTDELFKAPTSEYRGAPFWAWNCKLEREELERQIDVLHEMGFGGFHMHVRTGMDTPYLSDEYMALIKNCVDKARGEQMLAYLYDEDRWPSGAAGGLVTRDPRYRARYLLFTAVPYGQGKQGEKYEGSTARASRAENGRLLACFDVQLDEQGCLASYRRIREDEEAQGDKWYAYLEVNTESGWYNNQTYVNTLDKAAMDRFIEITYESYNRTIADEFDKTVPSIFTDEPQFSHKGTLRFARDKTDVTLPWTDDLPDTFRAAYGEDLLGSIPELFWELPEGGVSVIRYHYHDHICERFTEAFADNCGRWCREHHLKLTGHMMEEPTLRSQTAALGEAMRSYRGFDLPGIDMLCAHFEYTTAKQTQSAVHQYGCEGMTSELYGVTNWDFDFRGHKLHGDWQAALGVTVRVPHLSWVSMAGEAKRDYPASINYQSPWWKEYRYIEDHFARVNTALTRGKPVVRVGVVHPIESYWLHWGPSEQTALERDQLDQLFQDVTRWLLQGSMDFDFISESLLPGQCAKGGAPLRVGEMAYDVVVVPGCQTLRSSTLERLEAFRDAGGRLVFLGDAPRYENAVPSDRGERLYARSLAVPVSRGSLLGAVEPAREVEIRNASGCMTDKLLHQLRQDGEGRWLFIAHGAEPYNKDVSRFEDLRIRLKGAYRPTVYDTLTGEKRPIAYVAGEGRTEIRTRLYDYDSLLLYLEPVDSGAYEPQAAPRYAETELRLPRRVKYSLSEPNALLLDTAEYALDDGEMRAEEEILRLDNVCRAQLGWPSRKESFAQPWVVPKEPMTHTVHLRFSIESDVDYEGASLAVEDAERLTIRLNGENVAPVVTGYYVDRSIRTVSLPALRRGTNVLELDIPFGKRSNIEWCYLLGDFGVQASGRMKRIVERPDALTFGSFVPQGLPFYGGNVTYECPVTVEEEGEYALKVPHYRGTLMKVSLDGGEQSYLVYPPYQLSLGRLSAGEHLIRLTLFGHRRNGFGPVHLADLNQRWIGPGAWRSEGDSWCYDYVLCEEGVLSTPVLLKKQ